MSKTIKLKGSLANNLNVVQERIKDGFATMNNESKIVKSGFESEKDAINYVSTFPERHMPSFFVKEVSEYGLWDCFIKQT